MGFSKTIIAFLYKIFTYKQGSSALFSFISAMSITFTLEKLNKVFLENSDPKYIFLPVLVETVMIIIFLSLTFWDFVLGWRVAVKIRKEDFDWDRTFDTSAKVVGIILITTVAMFLAMVSESVGSTTFWWGSMISLCFLWILGIGFEYGSLGRNIEALKGSKPGMFVFFDRLLNTLQNSAIKRVENSFNIIPEEDDNKEDNPPK